jgi:hypothetical protein
LRAVGWSEKGAGVGALSRRVISSVALLVAVAGLVAYGAIAAAAGARRPSPSGLDVLPFPGTPDAAPATNIDFPAVAPFQIATVTVTGSRSGLHAGHLSAQPAGHGTAFAPDRPFIPGEHVTVVAVLRSPIAGTASGAPGARRLQFSFGVARFAPADEAVASSGVRPDVSDSGAASARHTTRSFISEPKLHPPVVKMKGRVRDPGQGYIFLDAQNTGHPGPYILTPKGHLIYFHPARTSVFNTRVQTYHNHPVLTYWEGAVVPPGVGRGKDLVVNEHYRTIHTITAGDGFQKRGIDLHEFTLGHRGSEATAFVTIAAPVQANLTSVGGPPNGTVFDSIIQEIDVATNKVIWEWHSLRHVPLVDSYARYVPGHRYDYFHLNSIQQLSNGHLIISARHTFAVYCIDKASGRIVWELGGKHSNFSMGPGASFQWQHHAMLHNNGLLTLFDDNSAAALGQSRGLELHIALGSHQATLVHSYFHRPHPALALSQGSVQVLANHNVFVGWGSSPHFAEYTPGGRQLFGGSFRGRVQSYRAYRFSDWVGNPIRPPALAVRNAATPGHFLLYASWDGATRVAKWRVLGSRSKTGPFAKVRPSVSRSGFQTRIYVRAATGPYFEVKALDSHRAVLPHGTSNVVKGP